MRLIDADALKKSFDEHVYLVHHGFNETEYGCTQYGIHQIIDEQPTVDAEPVIRCKDCKYYEVAELNADGTPDKRCKPSICANGWYEYAVERDPNWFCADAEPKEESDVSEV